MEKKAQRADHYIANKMRFMNINRARAFPPQRERLAHVAKMRRGGLYLMARPTGHLAWLYIFMHGGTRHRMVLGTAVDLSDDQALKLAIAANDWLDRGINPILIRKAQRLAEAHLKVLTDEFMEAYTLAFRLTPEDVERINEGCRAEGIRANMISMMNSEIAPRLYYTP